MTATVRFDFDPVRVVAANNSHGNPRVYVEVLGVRILYSDPYTLRGDPAMACYINGDGTVDTENLADLIRIRIANYLRGVVLADACISRTFDKSTDRDISHTPPRIEVTDD